ncbi:MAG: hypothetical protein EOO77_40870 [Oxalobacteraceae bacterium]|nr:MAG: hypothetical protein EOO77_40870 [Oxalobacteraceae bacterium]
MDHTNCMPKGLEFHWTEFTIPMKKALGQERQISQWLDQHPDAKAYWHTRVSECEQFLTFKFSDPEITVAFKLAFG